MGHHTQLVQSSHRPQEGNPRDFSLLSDKLLETLVLPNPQVGVAIHHWQPEIDLFLRWDDPWLLFILHVGTSHSPGAPRQFLANQSGGDNSCRLSAVWLG